MTEIPAQAEGAPARARRRRPNQTERRLLRMTRERDLWQAEATRWRQLAEAALADPEDPDAPLPEGEAPEPDLGRGRDGLGDMPDEAPARPAGAASAEEKLAAWLARAEAARRRWPDFDDVAGRPLFSATMQAALLDSERGPELGYWLATHPDEARAIAALDPVAQVRALGRLEARLEAEDAAAATSRAAALPDPPPVLTAREAGTDDPAAMSFRDYRSWRQGR